MIRAEGLDLSPVSCRELLAGIGHPAQGKRRLDEPGDDHMPDAFLAAMSATRELAEAPLNPGESRNPEAETIGPRMARPR